MPRHMLLLCWYHGLQIISTRRSCQSSHTAISLTMCSRAIHSAAFALIGSIGFLASALLPATSFSSRYGCLIVACCGAFSCIPPLLGWLSSNIHSTAAVGLAIALNISWGAPGQIVGVWIYKAQEAKKGYPTGHCKSAPRLLELRKILS